MTTFNQPQIAQRKYDETQFVNVRTYWSLTHNASTSEPPCDQTYELQVRHCYPADDFKFISHAAHTRDSLELVTSTEYIERVNELRAHEDLKPAEAAKKLSETVIVMTSRERAIRKHLFATWRAFSTQFNPATTL